MYSKSVFFSTWESKLPVKRVGELGGTVVKFDGDTVPTCLRHKFSRISFQINQVFVDLSQKAPKFSKTKNLPSIGQILIFQWQAGSNRVNWCCWNCPWRVNEMNWRKQSCTLFSSPSPPRNWLLIRYIDRELTEKLHLCVSWVSSDLVRLTFPLGKLG